MAELLPSAGVIHKVISVGLTSAVPLTIDVSPDKITIININYTFKKESRTMLFATGGMNVLLDDKTYGLNFSFADSKLTVSTTTNGNYGLSVRILEF